ncbi:pilus assembly protein PilP [Candidatus Nitrosacidococcus tergens]|uniref:Putative Pilus assembly protein PilP n=1 Tax=Candidatus Nitrosacidococcus tergens TaxID=553981 RepID=A0A7G1Q794_9GAMM|nr:pilus assembly protein PilP [Candidatus Nitrosacidococcus tergens]CAB1274236.1 putative Pilus assembly protein PilP [Candidatus Nitrosacidococcus tergens]
MNASLGYKKKNKLLTMCTCTIVVSFSGLFGCSNQNQGIADLQQYTQTIKSRPAAKLESLPKAKPYEKSIYKSVQIRDPFVPILDTTEEKANPSNIVAPDQNRSKEALEEYALGTLKMVGILKQRGEIWALVLTPDRHLYRAQSGNYIGKDYGKITRIDDGKIEILETFLAHGSWFEREVKLELSTIEN